MRLFGIILIFFNLAAGGGYIYLATQDWKGRQAINAAGLRHVLLVQGFPLEGKDIDEETDETPFVVPMAGSESTKTVSKKLLETYFETYTAAATGADAPKVPLATNTPVTNQLAELKRVFDLLKAELSKDAVSPAQKAALIENWLLVQAETMNERIQIQTLIAANDAEGLGHLLDLKFYRIAPSLYQAENAALAPAKWDALQKAIAAAPDDAVRDALKPPIATDEHERKLRLAHLLVHLERHAAWQNRVIAVVGLRRYVYAVSAQMSRFAEMRQQVELPIPGEQAEFQLQQDRLLNDARQKDTRAKAISAEKAKLIEQKIADDDAVNRRRTQLKDLEALLKKIKAEVDELLVQQTGIEKQLYEIQREVGLTLEDVYRLEALLTDIERERFGIPARGK